jgi:hypothetical protein
MNRAAAVFIQFPAGKDGRDRVAINVEEIASYRSHEVVSYSYREWVLVTLKSGKEHDLHITMSEFEKMIEAAYQPVKP